MNQSNLSICVRALPVLGIALAWSCAVPLMGQNAPNAGAASPSVRVSITPTEGLSAGVIVPSDGSSVNIVKSGAVHSGRRTGARAAAVRGSRVAPLPSDICFRPGVGWKQRSATKKGSLSSPVALSGTPGSALDNGHPATAMRAAYKTMPGTMNALCPQSPASGRLASADAASGITASAFVGGTTGNELKAELDEDDSSSAEMQGLLPSREKSEEDHSYLTTSFGLSVAGSSAPGYLGSLLTRARAKRQFSLSALDRKRRQTTDFRFHPGHGSSLDGSGDSTRKHQGCTAQSDRDHPSTALFPDVQDHDCSPSQKHDQEHGSSSSGSWLGRATF